MPSVGLEHALRVTKSVRFGPVLAYTQVSHDAQLFNSCKRSLDPDQWDQSRVSESRSVTTTQLKNHQRVAIVDGHAITVRKSEHFRTPNSALTYSAAPIRDTGIELLVLLYAAARNSPDDTTSQLLVIRSAFNVTNLGNSE